MRRCVVGRVVPEVAKRRVTMIFSVMRSSNCCDDFILKYDHLDPSQRRDLLAQWCSVTFQQA